ncbi:MAG: hypothetical protein IKB97_09720 [Bacteroidaceae bacterium]|nr:hypothetical protein [Bacteroidaceae bacterium]
MINLHADTAKELDVIMEAFGLNGLSIVNIDTLGVIEDITPKKTRIAEKRFGFCTDMPIYLELSDGRTLSINASSFKDVYEGFNITKDPESSDQEHDSDLDVADYCKECLGKKIAGYEVTKFGDDMPDDIQNITPESPKKLIIKLEDDTRMIFSHWLMAEYMDFLVELPKE